MVSKLKGSEDNIFELRAREKEAQRIALQQAPNEIADMRLAKAKARSKRVIRQRAFA